MKPGPIGQILRKVEQKKEEKFAPLNKELAKISEAAPKDQDRILQEVETQKQLGTGYADQYANKRAEMLAKLSNILVTQQNRQLEQNIPQLAEQANLRGIFRSTGLGNSIADRAKTLAADTSSELARQAIADQGANIADIQGVNQDYLQGRYSGLGRRFSLEDMARQGAIAKETGLALQPAAPNVPSAKGAGALQGGLGGAAAGSNFGPHGALAGAAIGAVGGGAAGGK